MNRAAALAGAVLVVTVALAIGVARSTPQGHGGSEPAAPAAPEGGPQAQSTAGAESAAPAAGEDAGLARSSDQGSVTVDVIPSGAPWGSRALIFEVAVNTHSVPLSGLNPAAGARLKVDGAEVKALFTWTAEAGSSGHHVRGTLRVEAAGAGVPLVPAGASAVTLEISGLGEGPARVFQWTRNS